MNNLDHFESYENILGEFWLPSKKKEKFHGTISYSPQQGITLKVLISDKEGELTDRGRIIDTIFGYTQEWGDVSLFQVDCGGYESHNFVRIQKHLDCSYILTGAHIQFNSANFDKCIFSLNHLNEFCGPSGRLNRIKKDTSLEWKTKLESTQISLSYSATLDSFNQLSDLMTTKNNAMKKEIDSSIEKILAKHNESYIHIRKNVQFYIMVEPIGKKKLKFKEAIGCIYKIRNLFNVLTLKDCYLTKIDLYIKDPKKKYADKYSVIRSQRLTEKHLSKNSDRALFFDFPINLPKAKKANKKLINKWFEFTSWETNIILSTVLDMFYELRLPEPLKTYSLLIASVERWFHQINKNGNHNQRYQWFIDEHANALMKQEIKRLLHITSDQEIGKALGDVRDCIGHPKKMHIRDKDFKKYKPLIEGSGLYNLCSILFLLLISAIYSYIGIADDDIKEFQNKFNNFYKKVSIY